MVTSSDTSGIEYLEPKVIGGNLIDNFLISNVSIYGIFLFLKTIVFILYFSSLLFLTILLNSLILSFLSFFLNNLGENIFKEYWNNCFLLSSNCFSFFLKLSIIDLTCFLLIRFGLIYWLWKEKELSKLREELFGIK